MEYHQIVTIKEIIIKSIPSLISVIVGIFIGQWFNRSKIWIGLKKIRRCNDHLVEIESDIQELTRVIPYVEYIRESQVSIKYLMSYTKQLNRILLDMENANEILSDVWSKLSKTLTEFEEKRELLLLFLGNKFICDTLLDKIINNTLPLPDSNTLGIQEEKEIVYGEDFTDNNNEKVKGFIIKSSGFVYSFSHGAKFYDQKTLEDLRIITKILKYFAQPHIEQIVKHLKQFTENKIKIIKELQAKVEEKIKISRKIIIEAQVNNLGGKPEQIDPHGLLEIKYGAKPIDPIIVSIRDFIPYEAGMEELSRMVKLHEKFIQKQSNNTIRISEKLKDTPVYITISPHQSLSVELISSDVIGTEHENAIEALEKGVLSAKLVMSNCKKNWFGKLKWFSSQELIMGETLDDKRKKELLKYRKS